MRSILHHILSTIPKLNHSERSKVSSALSSIDDFDKVCDLVETIQESLPHCPYCSHEEILKHGVRSGLQRFRCKSCHRTFNSLTNTPLARLRKKELWLSNLECMRNSFTVRVTAEAVPVNKRTIFLWRHRFTEWMSKDIPEELGGIVEADETYYRYSMKGSRHLKRKPHKRGGDAAPRGLSKDKVCVFTACDRAGQDFEAKAGLGSITGKWLENQFTNLVAKDAVLVTDGHKSYEYFCKKTKMEHIVVKNKIGQRARGCYHTQHINGYHHRLRDFIIGRFHGVATKYLDHYLSWKHELEKKVIPSSSKLLLIAIGQINH
jgi:transposase-like protein